MNISINIPTPLKKKTILNLLGVGSKNMHNYAGTLWIFENAKIELVAENLEQ